MMKGFKIISILLTYSMITACVGKVDDKDINLNTRFGNGEPFMHCKDCNVRDISMFIIPALGFDEYCNRIGFGKGYYDNILKENKNALRIGLSYDYQILPILPKDNSDEILDIIISENKVVTAIF